MPPFLREAPLGSRLPSDTSRRLVTCAHGLLETILEPNAENREEVCSRSRCLYPNADGRTVDAPHGERRGQLTAPAIPSGDISCLRSAGGSSPKIVLGSDSVIPLPAQSGRAMHPKKRVQRNTGVRHERLEDLWPCATAETFLPVENSRPASLTLR